MVNYFNILGIKPAFTVDLTQLKKAYFRLSREVHPDYHTIQADNKDLIIDNAAALNKAYEVIKDTHRRMHHILELHGMLEDEKKQLPQDFLMEMMDINEAIMELQFDFDPQIASSVQLQVNEVETKLDKEVATAKDRYDSSGDLDVLPSIREYYLKRKYLTRIKENLDTFAP